MKYRIRCLRKSLGMSQQELSQASGVSRTIISALESEKEVTTTTDTLSKLAKALKTNVGNIFFDDEFNKLDK